MTKRRHLTVPQKLQVLVRYCRCPECGEKFGSLDDIEFDHIGQLSMTGDNSLENYRPLHIACHTKKSARDAKDRAKARRLGKRESEFRQRILAPEERSEQQSTGKPKRAWPKRPFPNRQKGFRNEKPSR